MMTQRGHMRSCDVVFKRGAPVVYAAGQTVFVKTDHIVEFFKQPCRKPYILVTGDSDYSPSTFFRDDAIAKILENPLLIEWRSQNVCTMHPKLKHLAIGLEDTRNKLGFCRTQAEVLRALPKEDAVYTNFSATTNPLERSSFPSTLSARVDFETYMRTMAGYRYVMCPMGNGIDTHRFWEAQVCGCIPVVRCPKEFLPTYDGFPFICLPGWCAARLGDHRLVRTMESIFHVSLGREEMQSSLLSFYPESRSWFSRRALQSFFGE